MFLFFVICIGAIIAFYLGSIPEFLVQALEENFNQLVRLQKIYPYISVLVYVISYLMIVILCLPGAVFFTIVGSILFGTFYAAFYVVFSATAGAFVVFLWARYSCPRYLQKKISKNHYNFETSFRRNSLWYLLFLRLVPIFPFWLINIIPAMLGVSSRIYFFSTLFGIIPGTLAYCAIGSNLLIILKSGQNIDLDKIFNIGVAFPLIVLGGLCLTPIIIKKYNK